MKDNVLREINAIVNMLDHLQITMQMCEDKAGQIPLTYSYLYELGILRLLELFDADPNFTETLRSTTARAMEYLLAMYKEQGKEDPLSDKLKRLNDAIKKAKKGEPQSVEDQIKEEVPNTVGEFLERHKEDDCLKTKSMKDPYDKLLDEYLAGKKRAAERKKQDKKGKDGKSKS